MDEIQKQGGLVEMLEQRRYQMRNEKDDKILKKSGLTEMFPATWEEMLQAMEVMATNYDQKSHEAGTRSWEYSTVSNELSQQQSKLNSVQSELHGVKECHSMGRFPWQPRRRRRGSGPDLPCSLPW